MFSITQKTNFLIPSFLIIFFSTKVCYGQISFSNIEHNTTHSEFSKNNITLAMFNSTNEDTSKLSYDHRMSLYEKEKKSKAVAYLLNYLTMPFAAGHYYAGEPKRAMRWHITYAAGIGCMVLATKTQSDFWGYSAVGILSYAIVYSFIDVGRTVDYHNMKLRKKYDLVLNLENINTNGIGISLSFNF